MNRKVACYLMAVVLLATLFSCATFDKNAYSTLSTAKITYDTTLSALGDLQRQGKISDADVQKIIKIANIYRTAYLAAVSAYEVYHNNPSVTNQDQLLQLLSDVSAALGQLIPLLAPYNITVQPIVVPTK
jgi:hypothetical protein